MKPSRSKLEQQIRQQITLGKRLLMLGILLMFVGTYFSVQAKRYLSSVSRASGRIIEIEKDQHQKDATYYPVFSFVDSSRATNVIHTRTSQTRTWTGLNRFYSVGDIVEVLYPAGSPDSARLNNIFSVWGWALAFGGIGMILVIVGILLWHGAVTCPVDVLTSREDPLAEPD